jgi:hypothetical protein
MRTLPFAVALLGLAFAARAVTTAATGPAGRAASILAATNAAPAEPELPKSAFHYPISQQDPAKDPFYPLSTRRLPPPPPPPGTTAPPAVVVVDLELRGISGSADHRFAIINSRTFAAGEEGEVPANGGRAHIRVVEVKGDSAVVMVNGEQRVLRLRSGI